MVTMNKPSSNDTNWYQALTDNWTSIESNLLDKHTVTSKGDLVVAVDGSTRSKLKVGQDEQILVADSAQATGLKWMRPMQQEASDILWGKKFFQDEGFLPSTKIFEHFGTPPVFAGTAGSAAWTRNTGAWRVSASNGIGWYDLGAAYSKILVVIANVLRPFVSDVMMHLTPSAPAGLDPDGYSMQWTGVGPSIQKRTSGAYTRLDGTTGIGFTDYLAGVALYYDDATNTLKMFVCLEGQWFLAQSATDSTYTTLRYLAFQSGGANQRWATPYVCYAE